MKPEHIHLPEPVLDLTGAPTGRYICTECLDECQPAPLFLVDGHECPATYVAEGLYAGTWWLRLPDGCVIQMSM